MVKHLLVIFLLTSTVFAADISGAKDAEGIRRYEGALFASPVVSMPLKMEEVRIEE